MNSDMKLSHALPQAGLGLSTSVSAAAPSSTATAPVQLKVPTSNIQAVDPEKMRQQLKAAIEQLNAEMEKSSQDLRFSMDNVLDYPVVTVKNNVTGDVVRQIPNETTIRVAHNVDQLKGLLFNKPV